MLETDSLVPSTSSSFPLKRTAPRSPVVMAGASSPSRLQCKPFELVRPQDSPTLRPSHKRMRAPPPSSGSSPLRLPLPALADTPDYDQLPSPVDTGSAGGGADWYPAGDASCSMEVQDSMGMEPLCESYGCATGSSSRWRMVLYHDRNAILYNPRETPPFRSRRLSLEEAPANQMTSERYGRCPLCKQTIDARFAYAAQAYFDLLQGVFRTSSAKASADATEDVWREVDVVTESDLYRILGIHRTAGADDIKRAYRKRSLRYHPDKNLDDPDAKLKFQKVAEAFSVLSDEKKRAKYDKSGDMDLEDFDVEMFMNMVNASGFKYASKASTEDLEEPDWDHCADMGAISDGNPFILGNDVPVGNVFASEGGAEAEAAAEAALRDLPKGLLNTGYYARFFAETRPLGSGSFGAVFLCKHMLDDLTLGDYAVKKVPVGDNKQWLRDMIKEVKTFERLHHPNIVEYKHSWLELSRSSAFCPFVPFLFILMQYCNGGSLDELIWQDGDPARPREPLPVPHIWSLLVDILLGLQHLHRQGILHRDLKPTNILLQWLGEIGHGVPRALLSDFGTATPLGELPVSAALSRGYTGTVEYTAPELLQGDANEYTEKSDMWSLGIALYAMCFLTLPFSHEDPRVLKRLIRQFVAEHQPSPMQGGDGTASSDVDELSQHEETNGAATWVPVDEDGRLGPLRLVVSALLAFDPARRPAAIDLMENPTFRHQAVRHVRQIGDPMALGGGLRDIEIRPSEDVVNAGPAA
mmetsp:Transcript_54026/g.128705  ORF Transcript_54026/g.128705 Transcript_54026/m.128705 type:complete len:753 (-) Transcript_54026:81-2339(-)